MLARAKRVPLSRLAQPRRHDGRKVDLLVILSRTNDLRVLRRNSQPQRIIYPLFATEHLVLKITHAGCLHSYE